MGIWSITTASSPLSWPALWQWSSQQLDPLINSTHLYLEPAECQSLLQTWLIQPQTKQQKFFAGRECRYTKSLPSCLTLCNPVGSSPPGSSVHGILQARILEWVAISSSRGSSWPRDQTHASCVSCIGRQILYHWATWESPAILNRVYLKLLFNLYFLSLKLSSHWVTSLADNFATDIIRSYLLIAYIKPRYNESITLIILLMTLKTHLY